MTQFLPLHDLFMRCTAWVRVGARDARVEEASVSAAAAPAERFAPDESQRIARVTRLLLEQQAPFEVPRGAGVTVGMVQVGSATFRIVRLSADVYQVNRVLDDTRLGVFCCFPMLSVVPDEEDQRELLREVARTAIRQGRTEWRESRGRASGL